jgi:hypothetical protein
MYASAQFPHKKLTVAAANIGDGNGAQLGLPFGTNLTDCHLTTGRKAKHGDKQRRQPEALTGRSPCRRAK